VGFDLVTAGRICVDLYPQQIGVPLPQVESFSKSLGGSPTNVAVAAARLGSRSAVITKVGDDPFGAYCREALRRFGVDPRFVGVDPDLRTPLAFCEIRPPDDFPILFYRAPKAPDMNIAAGELPLDEIAGCRLFWTTGTGLSDDPSRAATLRALEVRSAAMPDGGGHLTVHDLDYRPALWSRAGDATELARKAIRLSTVVIGNPEEVEMATGTSDPPRAAEALVELGAELAIVKRGAAGVLALTSTGETVEVPAIRVEVKNGLGAGDAFGGALCHALLEGWETERALRFANAAGALVASRMLCADDMPTREEVDELLAGN
jgi:5-dehydro-2-deoxygluconokinase